MSNQQAKFPTFSIIGLCFSILGGLATMPFLDSVGGWFAAAIAVVFVSLFGSVVVVWVKS